MRSRACAVIAGCAALAVVALTGCSGTDASGSDGKLAVVASFYPLEFIATTVGGDAVHVTPLTAPGVEPHDLELTPKQVGTIAQAKVVFFEKDLQPAVDEAVKQNAPDTAIDIAPAANLEATGANFEQKGGAAPSTGGSPATSASFTQGAVDPHFWLDPVRYGDVITYVADRLAEADSAHADGYKQRADALKAEVSKLDSEYKSGLRTCKLKTFVTSHEAFAYLAKRYGLQMVGIAGFTPDAEPTPARIKEVQDIVHSEQVTTIFYEELVSPKVAESIARDVKVKTAVLSPVEGLSDANSKENYLSLMRANLQELRKANGCT